MKLCSISQLNVLHFLFAFCFYVYLSKSCESRTKLLPLFVSFGIISFCRDYRGKISDPGLYRKKLAWLRWDNIAQKCDFNSFISATITIFSGLNPARVSRR